ncbi:uncharacterized protein LOC132639321 [Lycium barbarum]|uniref:uncharacterized protein LOC132639321 n=1 Tax=Lycium barbarum TaxID=112863 RepID=UPI00293E32A0|nr:uncharacterized protein LOC132639321 [Lycium barbarum]
MSQGSCSSHVKCNCGTIAKHLTSSTPSNPGRKFYKCPRPKGNSCGFWEWEDELFPEIQWNNIQNLTSSLDAVKLERDKLQEELIAIEARHLIEVNKMKEELIGLKITAGQLLYAFNVIHNIARLNCHNTRKYTATVQSQLLNTARLECQYSAKLQSHLLNIARIECQYRAELHSHLQN